MERDYTVSNPDQKFAWMARPAQSLNSARLEVDDLNQQEQAKHRQGRFRRFGDLRISELTPRRRRGSHRHLFMPLVPEVLPVQHGDNFRAANVTDVQNALPPSSGMKMPQQAVTRRLERAARKPLPIREAGLFCVNLNGFRRSGPFPLACKTERARM